MKTSQAWTLTLVLSLLAVIVGACAVHGGPSSPDAGTFGEDSSVITFKEGGPAGALVITPASQTLAVAFGQQTPTLQLVATESGSPVQPVWQVDRGELASIDGHGLLTPTGSYGGTATITAKAADGSTGSATVTITISDVQNGGSDPPSGVGGEGTGGPVSSTTMATLNGAPIADSGLGWLYPYDNTVWPRGVLAPLLQWNIGAQGDYDAIYIHAYEADFDFKGYFAKTATPFSHHPIPQVAWNALEHSNGGEPLTVDVVYSKGNVAYGPITEKWTIGPSDLTGTVYYQSYGTSLVSNYCFGSLCFGGATLAIKHGTTAPTVVAGSSTECRVCHSVSADGSTLVTQHGDNYKASSQYALKTDTETPLPFTDGTSAFAAPYLDGTFALSNAAPLSGGCNTAPSALFALPSGSSIASSGLPSGLQAGMPVFSPDGKHVAFNDYSDDQRSLAIMDFNAATKTFSGFKKIYTPPAGTAAWPSYMPTSDGILFELETVASPAAGFGNTLAACMSTGTCSNDGAHGELWWLDVGTATATRLDSLNGKGYLPTNANNHGDDSTLNYEPTVNAVASGYAWVVFTSRRLYGNVATINPFWSDPRYHDISSTPTTKKLWVAAIDLNAKPGTDPSHPAFYLPGQELLAGNSRGYWVVDPCEADGTSCETGDECCGGHCGASSDGGLVCGSTTQGCGGEGDTCTTGSDCCSGLQCIGGHCDAVVN